MRIKGWIFGILFSTLMGTAKGGIKMLCEKCHQKPATVHMHQIINGAKTEIHLCQDCSTQIEAPISIETLFNGLLGSFLSMAADKQSSHMTHVHYEPCPTCGMTYEGFKSAGGKLGCAACYRVFSRELDAILKNVQASVKHEGKFPKKYGRAMFQKKEAGRLRSLMRKAIEDENFEEAARLRDEIRILEAAEKDSSADFPAGEEL